MKKNGIVFDLDGTLWDSCRGIASAWEEYIRLFEPEWYAKGVRVEEEIVRAACGKTMDIFTSMLLHQLPEEEQKRLYEPCCRYEVGWLRRNGAYLYEGMQDTLKELSGQYELFVVSNCQEGYIEAFVSWAGLEDVIRDSENYGRTGLPKDENIRLLVKRSRLDAAVYVGDTMGDYESACSAGIPFVFAGYGFGSMDREGILRVSDIRELPAFLEEHQELFSG